MNILLGLLFSACPPMLLVSCFVIYKTPSKWRNQLWMVVLCIMTLAYSYIPINNSDLVRYYYILDRFSNYSFQNVFHVYEDGMYVKNLLFWAISQTGLYGLLPAVTTGIVYGVASYISCSTAERYNKEYVIPVILFAQFLLLPFYSITNNIRNVMAFALVILAVYRDVELKKRNFWTIVCYVIPCFIHVAAVSLILLRFLIGLAKKHKYVVLAMVFFLTNIVEILYRNISLFAFSTALRIGISRAHRYLSDEYASSAWGTTVATSTWHRINMLINILLAVLVLIIIINDRRKGKNESNDDANKFDYYVYLTSIMTVSCLAFNAPHYWRYGVAIMIMFGCLIIKHDISLKNIHSIYPIAVWGLSAGEFVLQVNRLISVARSTSWLSDWLLSSPIRVIIELITNIL